MINKWQIKDTSNQGQINDIKAVYMKNTLQHRTFCPTSLTFLPDILCSISDMVIDKS